MPDGTEIYFNWLYLRLSLTTSKSSPLRMRVWPDDFLYRNFPSVLMNNSLKVTDTLLFEVNLMNSSLVANRNA